MGRLKTFLQKDSNDCGPACLMTISRFYGRELNVHQVRAFTQLGKEGVNLLGISEAAEKLGFKTLSVKLDFDSLIKDAPLPCIVHWNQNHFIVVSPKSTRRVVVVSDPAHGIIKYSKSEFCSKWLASDAGSKGIALLLEPVSEFYHQEDDHVPGMSLVYVLDYLKQHRSLIVQLFLGVFVASILQLIFPFLTQSIVDIGVNTRNLQYVTLILIAQLFLVAGRTITDFIRSRVLLTIGSKVNLTILTDFWMKLMKLPMSFFDTKKTGDIMQRLGDHARIQQFVTTSAVNLVFSVLNLFVFTFVLFYYSINVFWVFLLSSVFYLGWISFFLRVRRKIDAHKFAIGSKENNVTMQLIQGMHEIKLNNCDKEKRWEWERIQAQLFKVGFRTLSINQLQQAGAIFINESKNVFITFIVANAVVRGELTLGAMMAIQFIVGQLNSPIEQLVGFVQQGQDAKLSLDRLNEIHSMEDEEPIDSVSLADISKGLSINLNNVSFTYKGAGNEPVLRNVNLCIEARKVTAIVGMSGSGKTTLLKLLLKFYSDYSGDIKIGETDLSRLSHRYWRDRCSSVLQEGFIFNDTISRNIVLDSESLNVEQLAKACHIANLSEFLTSLPLGLNTKIGAEGMGVSQGQKQRILIARAVYRNPEFIFFDEATNSLDANNETSIMYNLNQFFESKTVVIVAHRLSTVRNANKIVVLNNGEIVEVGTHDELTKRCGYYYELVKNQLELGN